MIKYLIICLNKGEANFLKSKLEDENLIYDYFIIHPTKYCDFFKTQNKEKLCFKRILNVLTQDEKISNLVHQQNEQHFSFIGKKPKIFIIDTYPKKWVKRLIYNSVSYTHLTLPTILLV